MSNQADTWAPDETRSLIWRALRAAGERGTTRKELMALVGKSGTSMDWHLTNLLRDGHARRCEGPHGSVRWGQWAAGDRLPPIAGLLLELALAAIDDCPQGLSEAMLCQEVCVTPTHLQQLLAPAEADGRVQRMQMPAQHGGGTGWCLPGMQAAGEQLPVWVPTQADHPDVRSLPVFEVNIDAVHRKREHFAARISGSALSIECGSLRLQLTPQQTDQVRRLVLDEVAAS
jgi:hypothetical protein